MDKPSTFPYYDIYRFVAVLRGEPVEVFSKPGLPAWDHISPPTTLLAETPQLNSTDRVLLYGCYNGALAVILSHMLSNGNLWVTDTNSIALQMTKLTLEANHVSNANLLESIEIQPEHYGYFDAVFMQIPKGRKTARRWLLRAYQALAPGGNLFIAGANKEGIQSVIKDADALLGNVNILAYKKGNRLARSIKTSVPIPLIDWIQEPGIAIGTWYEFEIDLPGYSVQIHSLPGIFSYDKLDEGTELLMRVLVIPPGAQVLDVGCGYGILGMYAASLMSEWVDLVDNNLLAIASAQENIRLNKIVNAKVFPSDLLNSIGKNIYTLILSNPPFHTGQAVDYQVAQTMILNSRQALAPGGQLILVANKFIRYDRLMQQIYGNIVCLKETGKYHVLASIKT
jgi:16S rRNA G1207 methylase RsmC